MAGILILLSFSKLRVRPTALNPNFCTAFSRSDHEAVSSSPTRITSSKISFSYTYLP